MSKINEAIIKQCVGKYYVHFAELGSYEFLEYWVITLKEAKEKLALLQKEHSSYFGFIAKPIKVVRKE